MPLGIKMAHVADSPRSSVSEKYKLTKADLGKLHELGKEAECAEALAALGGTSGVAARLFSDTTKGVLASEVQERVAAFGANHVRDPPFESWISLFLGSFDDLVLKVLIVASVVSIIIHSIPDLAEGHTAAERAENAKYGWIDGFACVLDRPRVLPPASAPRVPSSHLKPAHSLLSLQYSYRRSYHRLRDCDERLPKVRRL